MRRSINIDVNNTLVSTGFALLLLNSHFFSFSKRLTEGLQGVITLVVVFISPIFFSLFNLYYLTYVYYIGFLVFLINFIYCLKNNFIISITTIITAFLVVAWVVPSLVNPHLSYTNPIFKESLYIGSVHIDTLLHMAIANMKQTYGVFSTGIDGLEPLSYHTASHYYLGFISKLFRNDMIFSYNVFYNIVFYPLFIYLFTATFVVISRKIFTTTYSPTIIFWIVFIVVLFSIFSDFSKSGTNIYLFNISSESYAFSGIFAFLLIQFIVEIIDIHLPKSTPKFWTVISILLAFIFLITFCKISVGFIIGCVFAFLCIRYTWFYENKRISLLIGALAIIITTLVSVKLFHESAGATAIVPFHYIRLHVSHLSQALYFYIFFFLWTFAYVFLRIYDSKKTDSKSFLDIEALLVASILSVIPSLILDIAGGSAGYFMLFPRQIGMVFFLAYVLAHQNRIQDYLKNIVKSMTIRKIYVLSCCVLILTIVLTSILLKTYSNFRIAWSEYINFEKQLLSTNSETQHKFDHHTYYYFINELDSLSKLSKEEKHKIAIHVPQADTLYWKHYSQKRSNKTTSFVIPAISGIMQLDGTPAFGELTGEYGFHAYKKRTSDLDTLSFDQLCDKAHLYHTNVSKILIYYPSEKRKIEITCQ